MAHIVPFRLAAPRAAEEAEETDAARTAGAEIVIFPGVRRERHVELQSEPPMELHAGQPGVERDWLVPPDEPHGDLSPDDHRA